MNKQDFVFPSDRWTTEVIRAEVTSRSLRLVSQQSDLNLIPDQLPTNYHLTTRSQIRPTRGLLRRVNSAARGHWERKPGRKGTVKQAPADSS